MMQQICRAMLTIPWFQGCKICSAAVLGMHGSVKQYSEQFCMCKHENTYPVHTSCSADGKHASTYSRLHPHIPHYPAIAFPTLPQGCDPGHLYSKSTVLCGKKHRHMHTHRTLCHLGLISRHPEQLWLRLSCVAVGRQRNAGRMALRAPTEGKLQGAASHHNSGENAVATLVFVDEVCMESSQVWHLFHSFHHH